MNLQPLKSKYESNLKHINGLLLTSLTQEAAITYKQVKIEYEQVLQLINEKMAIEEL